jgi:type IV secretory pathway VirJ component
VVDLVPTTVKLAPHKTGIEQLLTTAHDMANSNAKLDRATHIQRRWKLAKAWRTWLAAIADDANECTFSVGDRVEVVKDGNQRGKLATVTNGDWNGLVKVVMDQTNAEKSYLGSMLVVTEGGGGGGELAKVIPESAFQKAQKKSLAAQSLKALPVSTRQLSTPLTRQLSTSLIRQHSTALTRRPGQAKSVRIHSHHL